MNGKLKLKAIRFAAIIIAFFLSDRASAATISISWEASSSPTVAGYAVYYGYSSGNYSTRLDAGNQTNLTFQAPNGIAEYFFVATAYTASGLESLPSNEVRYQPDTDSPQVVIKSRISTSTTNNFVSLVGTANDNSEVAQVTWSNLCNNAVGVAAGTTNWAVNNVSLCMGTNLIAIHARDAAGNIGSTFFTAVRDNEPLCTYSITSNSWPVGAAGGVSTVGISASSGCAWTNSSAVGWLTVSPSGGIGSSNVTISASANSGTVGRSGTVTLAGQNFIVTQSGAACDYSITPSNANFAANGGTGSISVTAGATCNWSVSSGQSWVTVTSANSGTGNGVVTFSVNVNPNCASRSGVITVAGKNFTLSQSGGTGIFSISTTNISLLPAGGSFSIEVAAGIGCLWNVVGGGEWVQVTSGNSGAGNGTVWLIADPNTDCSPRTCQLTLANQTVTITQAASVLASLVNASFNGLFTDSPEGSGSFTLKKKGDAFSGKVSLAGRSHVFSGRFDSAGHANVTIKRAGKSSLTLAFQLDPCGPVPLIGTITDGTWVATLVSDTAVFDARLNPAPDAGTYTVAVLSTEDPLSRPPDALTPEGIGYASVQVYPNGIVKASGSLGDGVSFSHSAVISKKGLWPFYVSLYRGKGSIAGWLKFDRNETNNKPQGELTWKKSANPQDHFYKSGFSSSVAVMGSPYVPPVGLTNRVLGFSDGSISFAGGDLVGGWKKDVKLLPNNKVVPLSTGTDALSFSIRKANGTFKGTIKLPGYAKAVNFRGGILQNKNASYGLFIGDNQSGQVIFEPTP